MLPSGQVVTMNLAMGADGMMYPMVPVVATPGMGMEMPMVGDWVGPPPAGPAVPPPSTYGVSGYGNAEEWPKGLLSYLKSIDGDDVEEGRTGEDGNGSGNDLSEKEGEHSEQSTRIYLKTGASETEERGGVVIEKIAAVERESSNGNLSDGCVGEPDEIEVFI